MKDLKIEFVLHDKVGDVEVTPEAISLAKFNSFNQLVQEFIVGSERMKLEDIMVRVGNGSYMLTAVVVALVSTNLAADLMSLQADQSMDRIDPKRAAVMLKLQAESKRYPHQRYMIRSEGRGQRPIEINHTTNYRKGDDAPWVRVEKYLLGTIMDMGGTNKANVHLRLHDTGELIVVSSDQDYLKSQQQNRLYQKALLRIVAEQNIHTKQMRNYRLIAFEHYAPKFNSAALDRFAEEGRRAWADVSDPVSWVRKLRGGD